MYEARRDMTLPSEDVLADRLLEEADGRDDPDATGREVLVADHRADPAEVVDVAVRVDHGDHRQVGDMLADHGHRGPHRLDAD